MKTGTVEEKGELKTNVPGFFEMEISVHLPPTGTEENVKKMAKMTFNVNFDAKEPLRQKSQQLQVPASSEHQKPAGLEKFLKQASERESRFSALNVSLSKITYRLAIADTFK